MLMSSTNQRPDSKMTPSVFVMQTLTHAHRGRKELRTDVYKATRVTRCALLLVCKLAGLIR